MSQKATKAAVVKKPAGKRKAANGYKLPDPIPLGEIIRNVCKKEWQIGPSIGAGGFGEIYAGMIITKYILSVYEVASIDEQDVNRKIILIF